MDKRRLKLSSPVIVKDALVGCVEAEAVAREELCNCSNQTSPFRLSGSKEETRNH